MMSEIQDMYAALYGNELSSLSSCHLFEHSSLFFNQCEVIKRKQWTFFGLGATQRAITSALGALECFWDFPFLRLFLGYI
jgi:hypothetical protein